MKSNLFLLCITALGINACKTENIFPSDGNEKLTLRNVLIRNIFPGEYTNNNSKTEMILLFDQGFAAYVQDTIESLEFNSLRKSKVNQIIGLNSFEQVDTIRSVKRITSYEIKNDTLRLFYLPENDKTMYFKDKFSANEKVFASKLYSEFNGSIHNTIDIIENVDKIYKFNVVNVN